MLNRHKLKQIKHFEAFKYNVSAEVFERVKRYHAKNVLELIKKRPEPADRVLYIACGTGYEIKLKFYLTFFSPGHTFILQG
ncbi:MAG: hypothetical protein QMD05_01400 [Candidatus Brocadiaceae bacterium]|nr:hypothetical protein [Candidatus Brocadiaceae bacterium]